MAFGKKFGGAKKKTEFIRVGNMFQSEKVPAGASKSFATSCSGEYLEKVVEGLTKILEEGGSARFSLIKWNDGEHPVLTFSKAAAKTGGKRIKGADEGFHDKEEDQGGL